MNIQQVTKNSLFLQFRYYSEFTSSEWNSTLFPWHSLWLAFGKMLLFLLILGEGEKKKKKIFQSMFEKAQGLLNIKSLILNNMDDWSVNEFKKLDFPPFVLNIFKKLREEWVMWKMLWNIWWTKTKLCLSLHTKYMGSQRKHSSRCVKIEQGCIYLTAWKGFDGGNFVTNVDRMGSDLFCHSISPMFSYWKWHWELKSVDPSGWVAFFYHYCHGHPPPFPGLLLSSWLAGG